ncbi:MAG: ABC transporter substrate-binding protein [Clostridiales bacterium]|nr:ABC transporter substrate-binding protein [Clostridiales bacterium]
MTKSYHTKRIIALILSILFLLTAAACGQNRSQQADADSVDRSMPQSSVTAENTSAAGNVSAAEAPQEAGQTAETAKSGVPEELTVGTPNPMRGDFFTDMFGNIGSDQDVRTLIHGYDLINWDQSQNEYAVDPTVVKTYTTSEEKGNKTYRFTLWDDLYYSDGSQIKAQDYAFSLLLQMSAEMEDIGGTPYRSEYILGSKAYYKGDKNFLAGVRVLSDTELSITLDRSFLPYYYEEGLLLCTPYPISVIAPGCEVKDDGEGAYIDGNFNADTLKSTILDPATGYKSHPSVTSGAYVLKDFDGTTAHFEINPNFKGVWLSNADGANQNNVVRFKDGSGNEQMMVKPSIEKLAYTFVSSDDMVDKIKDGSVHLLNKVTYGSAIDDLIDSEAADYINYARVGLSFFTFSAEMPTVREAAVRQAIAWCMNREQMTKDFCGDYGTVVNGYYGIQQWEYLMANGAVAYPLVKGYDNDDGPAVEKDDSNSFAQQYARNPAEYAKMLKKWQSLGLDGLTVYGNDIEKANKLLDKAGWTLNRDGKKFRPGEDDVRCKKVGRDLVPLDLKLMYLEGNRIADVVQANAIDNLKACGILLTLVPASADELLSSYYRQTERTTDMIFLATNFHTVYDPAVTFSLESALDRKQWNSMYTDDKKLYQLAMDMRKTETGDVFNYLRKWVAFQDRYNDVLPAIPLYSNDYYDFYIPQLVNYKIGSHATWAHAILESYLDGNR